VRIFSILFGLIMTSDSGMEEQGTMGEEETQMGEMQGSMEAPQEEPMTSEAPMDEQQTAPKKKVGGRRAALKLVRENVERVGRDLTSFRKSHEASSKRLEKQIAQLRTDISALKSHVAKESSRAREKQDAMANKLLAKLSQKPKAAASKKKASSSSSSKKSKSKGKK
jgi:hypothetical protein